MAEVVTSTVRLLVEMPEAAIGQVVSLVLCDAQNIAIARVRGVVRSPNSVEIAGAVPKTAATCSIFAHTFHREGVMLAKTGRIYGMWKDRPGERFGGDIRVFTHTGHPLGKVCKVSRVEFDADADEGMASVTMFVVDDAGSVLLDPEANRAITVTCRLWVRAVPKAEVVPLTPGAVLIRQGGTIVRFEKDPMPDEAVVAMGGTVEHTEVVQ